MLLRLFSLLLALTLLHASRAQAQPIVHAVWSATANSALDAPALAQFQQALNKRGLSSPEVVPTEELLPASEGAENRAPPSLPSARDKEAALRARAKGSSFALLGRLHAADKLEIDLRLIDAETRELKDSTAVVFSTSSESPDLTAAVLRLDEIASRAALARRTQTPEGSSTTPFPVAAPPPRNLVSTGPSLSTDTRGWMRQRWSLLAAAGIALGTATILGIVVAKDSSPRPQH